MTSFEITKICRTCLSLEGALLSIYDNKSSSGVGYIADMLGELSRIPPKKSDGLPEKVCLACICEINRCYSFKMKCDNSEQTLRQLLNLDIRKEDEVVIEISEEDTSSVDIKAAIPKKHNIIATNQEDDHAGSADEDVIYSIQAEEELEASYYVLGTVEDENEQEDESSPVKMKLQEEQPDECEQSQDTEQQGSDTDNKVSREASATEAPKNELKCSECPMTFVLPKNLSKHIRRVHMHFETPNEDVTMVSDDTKSKTPDQENQENTADDGTDLLVEVKHVKPLRNAVDLDTSKHKCPRCGAGFAMLKSLKYHIMWNKCTEKQYTCLKCQKVFVSAESLSVHTRTHSSDYTCTICNETFTRTKDLQEHKAQKHTGKQKNQCPTCLKVFTMLSTLKDHMRTHSGERPFLCPICGKGFSQNPNLKQHLMRHNKTKPFKCSECDSSFVSKGELFSHMRSHTGDHPFTCDICNSAFTTSSSLVKHKRTHTGERPYACEFCPMRFTALNTLKNHRRTHTGERPYKCKFCRRGFAQNSDCTIHMRTHTGEKGYICQKCGFAFSQLGALRTHMKTHRDTKEDLTGVAEVTITYNQSSDEQKDEFVKVEKANSTLEEPEIDLVHYAIEECSSENIEYSGE